MTDKSYKYHVGGSVPADNATYVTRKADDEFYRELKDGKFCYVLNCRQMGKSSLRVRAMQKLQADGFACVAVDITAIGTSDITQEKWYAGIIYHIVESLNLDNYFDWRSWLKEHEMLTPVHRLSVFIEKILLPNVKENIIIFIDESDSIRSLPFKVEDFFVLIRACYNQRVDKEDYNRLNFAILGVASPSDLIQDKKRTPFNIGKAIDLTGFDFHEAAPLLKGLTDTAENPEALL